MCHFLQCYLCTADGVGGDKERRAFPQACRRPAGVSLGEDSGTKTQTEKWSAAESVSYAPRSVCHIGYDFINKKDTLNDDREKEKVTHNPTVL